MTEREYLKKLDAYKRSDAPVDVKEKAIAELTKEYELDGNEILHKARALFEESKSDAE